jgi:heme O synthase-like polyprenyltransferase
MMKIRSLIIPVLIFFMVFALAPRAEANPVILTVIAVIGVTTVFLAAVVDQTLNDEEDDRSMRAEQETIENAKDAWAQNPPAPDAAR